MRHLLKVENRMLRTLWSRRQGEAGRINALQIRWRIHPKFVCVFVRAKLVPSRTSLLCLATTASILSFGAAVIARSTASLSFDTAWCTLVLSLCATFAASIVPSSAALLDTKDGLFLLAKRWQLVFLVILVILRLQLLAILGLQPLTHFMLVPMIVIQNGSRSLRLRIGVWLNHRSTTVLYHCILDGGASIVWDNCFPLHGIRLHRIYSWLSVHLFTVRGDNTRSLIILILRSNTPRSSQFRVWLLYRVASRIVFLCIINLLVILFLCLSIVLEVQIQVGNTWILV